MIFGAALLAFTAGRREEGFDLEFHMPVFVTRIELTINQSTGQEPRRVRSGVYAIALDEHGKATLRSSWPIARYHREFVVTPTERLQMPADACRLSGGRQRLGYEHRDNTYAAGRHVTFKA
jgi:hypothetical protein